MGKTSKKSASKVEAPKAVAAPTKPLKKGKREAEAPIDKEVVSAKKQKLDVKKVEKVAPKKTEKVAKKKVETSSDDDTSSSESEELPKVNVVAKDKMEIDSDDSSSDDSSGLEEVGASKKAPASATKNGHVAVAKKKEESSDESDSDDSSSDDEPVAAAKKAPAAPAKKKDESSDESDSETDDSSSDDEAPAVLATKATAVPVKKDESSSDDSDSDDESSSDEEVAVKKAPAADAKKTSVSAPKKKESSSDESSDSDDDSSSDSDDKAVKVATAKSTVIEAKQVKKEDSEDDSSDEDSSEESDEEPQKKTTTPAPSKKKSSSGSSSEDESSEDEAQPAITPKKKDADVKMADAEKTPKTPFTPKSDTDGSTSIFFGNMAFSIDKPDIHEFFKEVGTVVDVRFAMQDDQFKGYGHVEFSSAEEAKKAIDLNGRDLLGRPVRLDLARARGAQSSDGRPAFQKRGEGPTVFVRGFGQDASEDEVRSSLQEHFGKCGELANVRIPVDYESKSVKGIAYIEFKEAEAYNNALELSGSDMGGYSLYVDEARPRGDAAGGSGGGGRSGGRDFGGRSNGRGFGGRSGGGRGRDFGGRRGGGRDFGGGRGGRGGRGGFNKPSITPSGKKTTFNDDE